MEIDGKTAVLVHLAYPSGHLRTPQLFNRRCAERGIAAVLVPWQVHPDHLAEVVSALRLSESVKGLIVTVPHKETAALLCDRLEGVADILKVANVIRRDADGKLVGRALDGEGFVGGLRNAGHDLSGRKALMIGAGGVALAIAASLMEAGVSSLTVANRTRSRAEDMCARLQALGLGVPIAVGSPDASGFDLVVNASSLGMKASDPLPVPEDTIAPDAVVGEVVMAPERTPLLEAAARRGAATVPGAAMLFGQIDPFIDFVLLHANGKSEI